MNLLRTSPPIWIGTLILLVAWLAGDGCDSGSPASEPDLGNNPEPVVNAHPLVGTWQTSGTHERLGEVAIEMTLEEDGSLRMVVELTSGGSLSFPGTWEVDGQTLILRGAFFAPDEMSEVSWSLTEDGHLLLVDAAGASQEWRPKPSG
jgi:hypothetical protein